MIEQLSSIVTDAGASAIHLSIRPDGQGGVQVTLNTEGCPLANTDEQKKQPKAFALRQALAQPLIVCGPVGEMDVFMIEELTKYADTIVPAQQAFNTLSSNGAKASASTKQAVEKSGVEPQTSPSNANPESADVPLESTEAPSDEREHDPDSL
ncbi:hypothetical protein K0504_09885 [Neiella marina]|uniref:Uncharacterized protein n=1 Tax=Neiella holothuriorum TaxID=2870530 RepID=A0ABS7EI79_9GAMM|nr:hypothetical protein [Neiella holothuriorum]MBW8191347.1 hypothetical protein [Neiella holothuriorum]